MRKNLESHSESYYWIHLKCHSESHSENHSKSYLKSHCKSHLESHFEVKSHLVCELNESESYHSTGILKLLVGGWVVVGPLRF